MRTHARLALLVSLALLATPAAAERPCGADAEGKGGDCFAVFIMPDTQYYVEHTRNALPDENGTAEFAEQGATHLKRMMQWLRANRRGWVEPETGVRMDIELLIHLGDLIDSNSYSGQALTQWRRIDEALCVLDDCDAEPGEAQSIRYLAVAGNHDWDRPWNEGASPFVTTHCFTRFAGEGGACAQLAGVGKAEAGECAFPPEGGACESAKRSFDDESCSGIEIASDCASGWYLGGGGFEKPETRVASGAPGNRIPARSRAGEGPPSDQAGRHRAGVIRAPRSGRPFLFLGLEFQAGLRFSSAWPQALLDANPDVPALLFNHEGLSRRSPLVTKNPQVFLTLAGHGVPRDSLHAPRPVPLAMRNYQSVSIKGSKVNFYGSGIHLIAIVDPVKGELRMHPYRIDNASDATNANSITSEICSAALHPRGSPPRDCSHKHVGGRRTSFPLGPVR